MYLGVASFRTYHDIFEVEEDDDDNDAQRLSGVTAKKRHLEDIMSKIRVTILSAINKTYLEEGPAQHKEPWDFIEFSEVQRHYQAAAVTHIRDCARELNILTLSTISLSLACLSLAGVSD